ncbi:MAG: LCP family protein [Clostridiales bacterium]|nr:LCP family protein [Clostridiales bacterium]
MKKIRWVAVLLLVCLFTTTYATEPAISVLERNQIPATPRGMHHYLLVCMDSWGANLSRLGYSDGMVLITIDEASGRIITTSFIRDTLVIRPDGKPGRLTYVMKEFGINGLMDTLNRHFGLQIEKYILMDWSQVSAIVDIVGGVNLEVTAREAGYLKRYAISPTSTRPAMDKAGPYYFKGHAAVIYMRCRRVPALNGDKYDMGRTFRARYVLRRIAESLKDISYEDAYDMFRQVFDALGDKSRFFHTNISMADLMQAFQMVFALKGTQVEEFRLPIDGTFNTYIYAGGQAQLMDFEANRLALRDFLFDKSFVVID